jgi:hypothetical protein
MVTATKKVTKPAVKAAPKKSTRVTSQSIRENAKRDLSPKWEGADDWSVYEYTVMFREALKYYRLENSAKELKPKVIDWMGRSGYGREQIAEFKKTKDWRCNLTMGAIAACLIRGMPDVKQGFNGDRSAVEWLKEQISNTVQQGRFDLEEVDVVKAAKITAPVMNIQDRIREQSGTMSEEIDYAIDAWVVDPEAFDPKAFKMVNLLRGKGAKAAQARYIKSFFVSGQNELTELASGGADEQLRESYKHLPRKHIKKLIDFYESIMTACEQIIAEAKVLKKPRAAKIKPAEDQVKKLKFMLSDTKVGITSVPPATIIGAQTLVVYNTRTRKLGYYIAKTSSGLGVKNSSITEFTEKSMQKTLRKPAEQLKEFKEQNTQKRSETWFVKSIKTTETLLNGRISEDVVILKVYK